MQRLSVLFVILIIVLVLMSSTSGMAQTPGYIASVDLWEVISFSSTHGTCGYPTDLWWGPNPPPNSDVLNIGVRFRYTYRDDVPYLPPNSGTAPIRVYDGLGTLLHENRSQTSAPGAIVDSTSTLNAHYGSNGGIYRPLSVVLFDGGTTPPTEIARVTFDPADYDPSCASVPYANIVELENVSSVTQEVSIYEGLDNGGNPALDIYGINDEGEGYFLFSITEELLAPYVDNSPTENTELESVGDVTLYILTTGEYQLNIGPDEEGKVRVIIFEGLPPTNIYSYDFNVYDILEGE